MVKTGQIPQDIFESTSHFSFKFCINFQGFQIALRGGGRGGGRGGDSSPPTPPDGGTRNFEGETILFYWGGICTKNIFFWSFEAFVMLRLIFHIYWTSVNKNWHQTVILASLTSEYWLLHFPFLRKKAIFLRCINSKL